MGIYSQLADLYSRVSVYFFYCREMEMPKAVPVLAIVLGVLFPLILSVYLLLGIIDIGFNIRNKVTRN